MTLPKVLAGSFSPISMVSDAGCPRQADRLVPVAVHVVLRQTPDSAGARLDHAPQGRTRLVPGSAPSAGEDGVLRPTHTLPASPRDHAQQTGSVFGLWFLGRDSLERALMRGSLTTTIRDSW